MGTNQGPYQSLFHWRLVPLSLSIGLPPWIQALRTNPDIATLNSKLRLAIHSAPAELCFNHTFTCNAPAHTALIRSYHTLTTSQTSKCLIDSQTRRFTPNSHLRVTSPSWCGRREISLRAIITLLAPALRLYPSNVLQVGTARLTLSTQRSHLCERLLLMNRVWK